MKQRLYYDLHLHSCLSPCGDDDMTPADIVGMARLKELDVIALTDHNTCRNCAAVMQAAGENLLVIPGMELCTCEEIHVVCLFESLEAAQAFEQYVETHAPYYENEPAIYGHQYLADADDTVVGEVDRLLVTATDISLMELPDLMRRFAGVCIPAHIDKAAYSVLSVLGDFPPDLLVNTVEIAKPQKIDALCTQYPLLKTKRIVTGSDAHYLWDISERYYYLDAPRTVAGFVQALREEYTE